MAKNVEQSKKEEKIPVETAPEEKTSNDEQAKSAVEFIKINNRKHSSRANSTKRLRMLDELKYINAFTIGYLNGDLEEKDIKILADTKAFLMQLSGNPHNMKEHETNAIIHGDCKELCIDGIVIGEQKVKLVAKSVSANRVAYWNPVLEQQLIRDEKDPEKKKFMEARAKIIHDLPNRVGYGAP